MNLNPKMIELGEAVGLPIEQDLYEGGEPVFLTFTYDNEEDGNYGDNAPRSETCWMQVSLYSPKNHDYRAKKEEIKNWLRGNGFLDVQSRSWLEDPMLGTQRRRHTVFECRITKGIGKKQWHIMDSANRL
jgi:hypothetical protein